VLGKIESLLDWTAFSSLLKPATVGVKVDEAMLRLYCSNDLLSANGTV